MTTATEPGRLLPESRAGIGLLLALALPNGLFLYLLPSSAEADYAWAIKPDINAALLGAGYLGGVVATTTIVLATRYWRSLRALAPALVVLSLVLLVATLIHEDRFRWDYAPTWLWTAVYIGVPIVVTLLWVRQERREGPLPEADPRLQGVRVAAGVLGTVLALFGAALFLAPSEAVDASPWPLTPLMARAFAGWCLLAATIMLVTAVTLRRANEVIIPFATVGTWALLLLLLPLLYDDRVDGGSAELWAFVALQALMVAAAAVSLALGARIMRAERLRL